MLPVPPFRAICIKAAELEAYSRHPNSERNEDKVHKDVHRSIKEEIRKQDQASRAAISYRNTSARLLGSYKNGTKQILKSSRNLQPEEDYDEENMLDFISPEIEDGSDKTTKMMPTIVKLTGVTIFPKVDGHGGDAVVGTLEAHADKFIYKTSTSHFNSHLTFKYENIKEAFVQAEDEDLPYEEVLPLLHFRLHHPIKVGREKREHLQFRLVQTDSDDFEKEKQTRDGGRSNDLSDFVYEVGGKWSGSIPPFSFWWVCKRGEFHGIHKGEIFNAVLTFGSLLQLEVAPFVVVNLEDIEIINLARLGPQEIDMTVIFKNFTCPILQIRSIPLDSLEGIKRCLDFMRVKYYENNLDLNWDSIVKKITDSPEMFIRKGGWDAYQLEDSATSLYNKYYRLDLSQTDMMKEDTIMDMCC